MLMQKSEGWWWKGGGGEGVELALWEMCKRRIDYFLIRERPTEAYFADSNISLNIQIGNLSVATKTPLLVATR